MEEERKWNTLKFGVNDKYARDWLEPGKCKMLRDGSKIRWEYGGQM